MGFCVVSPFMLDKLFPVYSRVRVSIYIEITETMNIARLAGDMTHLASVLVLLVKIHTIVLVCPFPFSPIIYLYVCINRFWMCIFSYVSVCTCFVFVNVMNLNSFFFFLLTF